MVLPNKFPVKLSQIVEAAELKMPEPEVNKKKFLNSHKLRAKRHFSLGSTPRSCRGGQKPHEKRHKHAA